MLATVYFPFDESDCTEPAVSSFMAKLNRWRAEAAREDLPSWSMDDEGHFTVSR